MSRRNNVWYSLDWYTVALYLLLVFCGWISIYAASYDYETTSTIFSLDTRSGKQLLWIFLSLVIAFCLLMTEPRTFVSLSYPLYIVFILLLVVTIFVAPDIKGSHSWLVLGPVSLQPAEFAKYGTALALAKMLDNYDFDLRRPLHFFKACALILFPVLLILLQSETGSALVYLSLICILYREGMSGIFLFAAFCAVVYFILAVKYSSLEWLGTPVGEWVVLTLILLVLAYMVSSYLRNSRFFYISLFTTLVVQAIAAVVSYYFYPFNLLYVVWPLLMVAIVVAGGLYFKTLQRKLWIAVVFALLSCVYLESVDYVFTDVLGQHQRTRIEVAFGLKEDPMGVGYNVNQSKIAIGSGGFWGKGFLEGTQTKLRYVPEQDTDFIFCTIGEEQGFFGASAVLILFALLLVRIIQLSERQRTVFGRVYGYCVAAIIFFHLAVNIGMVIGVLPVIGIPLPFFSYGGSSLWGFTILLFTLLCIDASRGDSF